MTLTRDQKEYVAELKSKMARDTVYLLINGELEYSVNIIKGEDRCRQLIKEAEYNNSTVDVAMLYHNLVYFANYDVIGFN